jgi:hypothetical protein
MPVCIRGVIEREEGNALATTVRLAVVEPPQQGRCRKLGKLLKPILNPIYDRSAHIRVYFTAPSHTHAFRAS